MNNLLKKEFLLIKYSKVTKIFILIFALIYLSHTIECYYTITDLNWYESLFISGSTFGHTQSILLLWFLPLHLLVQQNLKTYNEFGSNYSNIAIIEESKMKILLSKLIFSFLYAITLFLCLSVIDIGLSLVIHQKGQSMYDLNGMRESWPFMYYKHLHPINAVLIYTMSTAMYFGFTAMMCSSLCLIIKDFKIIFGLTTLINLILWTSTITRTNKIIQPFVEGTFKEFMFHFIATSSVLFIIIIIASISFIKGRDYV